MHLMKILLIPILLIRFAGFAPALEQEPGLNGGIHIRGFAVAYFKGIDMVELRQESRLLVKLELATGQLDLGQSVRARQFSYGITKDQVFVPMGTIKLPDTGRNFILVFVPTVDSYRVFPVRADDPEFKGNDALLFNFTPYRIHARIGTSKQAIDPGKSGKLRPAYEAGATFYRALFGYQSENEGIIPFNNTRWPVNDNLKALVFVSMDPRTNTPFYRSVVELASSAAP